MGKGENILCGLGICEERKFVEIFEEIPFPSNTSIDMISCGDFHSMVLSDGKVFGCGSNCYGQITGCSPFGLVFSLTQSNFVLEGEGEKIVSISCVNNSTLLLSDLKIMYRVGRDMEVPIVCSMNINEAPIFISSFKKIDVLVTSLPNNRITK
jgi:alpha-tubulin suppressor-like RCC1 family protein